MKSKQNSLIMTLFLLGIFMGAIDNGIVSPAREIIQNSFGVAPNLGMWMITIYTLFFAVSMPIVSKLADRYGHKLVYTLSIAVFGMGSLFCGLSNFYGNFSIFLVFRVIQAIGAGGIIPIAHTVIGLSFPEEKRGTALGLVGAIYGVATIVGPTLGSTILGIAGNAHWGWIFFINVPITILILGLSLSMENTQLTSDQPLDVAGAIALAGVIGSIMYALTNMDFFHLKDSITNISVYPYLLSFAVLVPVLVYIENRAKDPIMNLKYFLDRQMLVTFILAFIVGTGMMVMIFVPQFAENILKIRPGSGGYLVTLLALFSGIAAPISGKLIDRKGARFVMQVGFLFAILGALFLGYAATKYLNLASILVGLSLLGFGVGFTMGAPLNYLVLQNAKPEEGATALATMSLIRSIGITVSPSIMIGFIIDAAKNLQPALTSTLQQGLASMPMGAKMIPTNMAGSNEKTAKLFSALQNADVTTIVDRLKEIFVQVMPEMQGMIIPQIEKMRQVIESTFQSTLNTGYTHMFTAAAIIMGIGLVATFFLNKKGGPASTEA